MYKKYKFGKCLVAYTVKHRVREKWRFLELTFRFVRQEFLITSSFYLSNYNIPSIYSSLFSVSFRRAFSSYFTLLLFLHLHAVKSSKQAKASFSIRKKKKFIQERPKRQVLSSGSCSTWIRQYYCMYAYLPFSPTHVFERKWRELRFSFSFWFLVVHSNSYM